MRAWLLTFLMMFLTPCFAQSGTLILTTESYPPFAYLKNGMVEGSGVTLVTQVMKDTGQPYRIEIMTWSRAIALARKESMHCVFATARTPERENLFKWVEPLITVRNHLVGTKASGINPATLDEAKAYTIGTHRNDFSENLLRKLGFPRIDTAADMDLSIKKLINGRIDLVPMADHTYEQLVASGYDLQKTVLLSEQQLGIACNPSVPDELVRQMNENLRKITDARH